MGSQYLIFKISGKFFAVSIKDVERIIEIDFIYKVPLAQKCFDGLVKVDERAIPIFNIACAMGMKSEEPLKDSVVAIEKIRGHDIGLLVSDLVTISRIPADDMSDFESDIPGVTKKAKWNDSFVYMLLAEDLVFSDQLV